jgi:hypothetical protein
MSFREMSGESDFNLFTVTLKIGVEGTSGRGEDGGEDWDDDI